MNDVLAIFQFAQTTGVLLLFKILLLVLLFVYAIFAFIVMNRIKALNRTVYITSSNASGTLQFLSLLFFFLTVSLFILTIVIV
jgi:hypothetical protein